MAFARLQLGTVRVLVVALVTVVSLAGAAPASGYHIAGATYTGTHSQGGTVRLSVSSDGKRVTRFKATNIQGDTCTVDSSETTFAPGRGPEIEGHFVSHISNGGGFNFDGPFHRKKAVRGNFFYDSGFSAFGPSCQSIGDVTWRARTTASAARTAECRKAKRAVRRARKALGNASGNKAKARKKLRKAKKRRKRDC